ncbi:OprO/OprP family phosphate-selective porin [Dokdonella sp. MW10]|uniref:OprO/OprP family phosphate-selective porin n=1 Tax=Dokdonella sp. MW10 TaxID=2992926 RepID=UPI003F7F17BF
MRALSCTALLLVAASTSAAAWDRNDWPTKVTFDDGTELGASLSFQYDLNRFSNDTLPDGSARFADDEGFRRREFGFSVRKKGVWDAGAVFDFEAHQFLDVYARVQSKALFGRDLGAFRIGQTKTPVGFEGVTSSRATSFLETALPTQAIHANRRIGIDWALERPTWILNLGAYDGDLAGDFDGPTVGGRVAWTPIKADGHVLHLGVAATRESPDTTSNGRGDTVLPSARFRSRPEAGLTDIRLVDSGSLSRVEDIDRTGLEALWIDGPFSVQGEYLRARAARDGDLADYRADGWYAFGSWVVTGESRPYSGGNSGNIKPKGRWGAVELLLRYSALDLDDRLVRGGRQHDWTLGANWYLDTHFKLQANVIRATSDRGTLALDPHIVAVRAQVIF